MKYPKLKLSFSLVLVVAAFYFTAEGQRQLNLPSDEAILERVPEGVTFIPNIAYREGNEAWKLDLAMPSERSQSLRPAIVFVHGGGWRNGDKRAPAFLNPTLSYAAKGYVCITVNYRLQQGNQPRINECVEDVKNAVRWLRAHAEEYHVDSTRIGASGNSAGAHLSLMLGLCPPKAGLEGDGPYQEYSSLVQAVAASASPTSFLMPMSERGRERFEKAKAAMEANPGPEVQARKNYLSQISPISYISADAPPMLLFHEASDKTVGVYQSDSFVQALRDAGAKDVNYLLLGDGTGHGTFQRNIGITEPMREAFFNRVLKPEKRNDKE